MDSEYYSKGRKQIGILQFLRDALIARLPQKLSFIAKKLLPYSPDFIFLVHPRNEKDIESTFPFIKTLRQFLPESFCRKILSLSPCYIVSRVNAPAGRRGYVISTMSLPNKLFESRELTLKISNGSLSFFRNIASKRVYVGLAAWWPIVTNSGLVFAKQLSSKDIICITSGHTATLASIYLSVLRLCEIIQVPFSELRLLIVGVGKVGGAICDLAFQKVKKLGLIDKNPIRLQSVKKNILGKGETDSIELIPVTDENSEEIIVRKLSEYDITVCTTSNVGLLVKDETKLKDCIILDDSRPEAFPRIFSSENHVAVLEGGLIKIKNVELDSDFGFGTSDNLFGCLSEAVMLSLDNEKSFKPNIGEVDYDNMFRLIDFCKRSNIQIGEFKCGQKKIEDEDLAKIYSLKSPVRK